MVRNSMLKGMLLMAFAVLGLGLASGVQAAGVATGPDKSRPYVGGPNTGGASAATASINGDDRAAISSFLAADYSEKCGNEADQKKNKCRSPAEAGKYGVGAVLPADSGATNLPDKVRAQLKPDAGHQYVRADGDVLLVNSSTKYIADAVTLGEAIGN